MTEVYIRKCPIHINKKIKLLTAKWTKVNKKI